MLQSLVLVLLVQDGSRNNHFALSAHVTSATVNIDGEVNGIEYNPQQTCQPWTTPGYRSLSRSLERAHQVGANIDQVKAEHTAATIEAFEAAASLPSATCSWEPNLLPMVVQFAGGLNETFYAYVTPDVSTLYNYTKGSKKATKMQFIGLFAKFINMSPDSIQIYWIDSSNPKSRIYISDIEPFGAAATASYPKHKFIAVKKSNTRNDVLIEWTMETGNSLYYYDPHNFNVNAAKKAGLTTNQLHLYHVQLVNRAFAYQYKLFTGTDWLALYKHRKPPRYHMWRCDSFGQTHSVDTSEIHFTELPPDHELYRSTSVYGPRPHELERMRKYKATEPILNLTLTALSCAPRVFEVSNFLSDVEVDHIITLARKSRLDPSKTRAGESSSSAETDTSTRTSRNTWIPRNNDMIIDGIYRRAADVLQIHEALLRWRRPTEMPEFPESMISIAESLQLVHYDVGQQYTPHHDFTMPAMVKDQPARFATMLFYLNDDMQGGETSFPRWLNAKTSQPLKVKPKRGKAVLFYNMLPDGNYDERSQHEARKVTKGEKFLTNLWIWDPILDHTTAKHI